MQMLEVVLKEFGFTPDSVSLSPITHGLINNTWKLTTAGQTFILQKINTSIFTQPENIAHNIASLSSYLKDKHPDYFFVQPVISSSGKHLVTINEGCFRLFPFVEKSHSIDVVQTPEQAYEAAKQFGKFSACLSSFNTSQLKTTIPDFHNLSLRYKQFLKALITASAEKLSQSSDAISQCKLHTQIADEYEAIKTNPECKLRVTHHDTKISNVLFNENNKGICVIDLDTVMPGYFISDVGDMMRTYLCPVSEEETDVTKIEIRSEMYNAITSGYYEEMKDTLTETEKKMFTYAGKFMIYMQALRFLTDYLNNDIYYGSKYPGHNLNRALNQLTLLKKLIAQQH